MLLVIKRRGHHHSDRVYPYDSLAVSPTDRTLSFTCRNCKLGQEVKVYRDVRENATVVGNPPRVINTLQGWYEFVLCSACNSWFRVNDWKRVSGLRLFDRVMSMPASSIGGEQLSSQPSLSYPNIANDQRETILGHTPIAPTRGFYSPAYYLGNYYDVGIN